GDLAVVPPAEEFDAGAGERSEAPILRAGADDHEPPAEPPGRADRQVDALVGDERRHHEVVVVDAVGDPEPVDVDRRGEDVGLAAPNAPDPPGHGAGRRVPYTATRPAC